MIYHKRDKQCPIRKATSGARVARKERDIRTACTVFARLAVGANRQGAILKLVPVGTSCSMSVFRRLLTNILTPVTGTSVTCYLRHSKSAITIDASVCLYPSPTSMPYLEQQVLVATRKSTWLVTVDFETSPPLASEASRRLSPYQPIAQISGRILLTRFLKSTPLWLVPCSGV